MPNGTKAKRRTEEPERKSRGSSGSGGKEMGDESNGEEFSFPMIVRNEDGDVDDVSVDLGDSIWHRCSTTTVKVTVSECCSFPTCPHNPEVANQRSTTTTKEEEVEERRSSGSSTTKTTVPLPRSPTTTASSPRVLLSMDTLWDDHDYGNGSLTPSRRRRSFCSAGATPRSFNAEDLEQERMDMLWEEYHEHEELVAMGIVGQFFKKQWMDDDDDDSNADDDDDDGESSPYTASYSSTTTTATTPSATAAATPEMMARLCCVRVIQMSKGSPTTAVMPLRRPGLRVIFKVLKKLFLLHHSPHHHSSRKKLSSSA